MTTSYGTRFVETEALAALINGDEDTARTHLAEMLPRELAQLRRNARQLSDMCAEVVRTQARDAVAEVED